MFNPTKTEDYNKNLRQYEYFILKKNSFYKIIEIIGCMA